MRFCITVAAVLMVSARQQANAQFHDAIDRRDIPNEFMEITIPRGTIHIIGSGSDQVSWNLIPGNGARRWGIGSTKWRTTVPTDRGFTLGVNDLDSLSADNAQPVLEVTVPRTLRILHVTVRGGGHIDVSDFSGEISATADSGDIVGRDLRGTIIFEARRGGIQLDLSSRRSEPGPIDLLARMGSIALTLSPQASLAITATTDCGELRSDFVFGPDGDAGQPAQRRDEADCKDRPKNLPVLPGVVHLHYWLKGRMGSGASNLHAMTILGDIDIKRKGPP